VGTCCGGTGLENHTKYQDSIYFRSVDETTLYVNLYIASILDWPEKGFRITQTTQYPKEGSAALAIEGNGPLDVKLRVPEWVRKGYFVSINGEAQEVDVTPGAYLTLNREWNSGDTIEISMPFSFRAEPAIDDDTVQSLYYGPTLMAIQRGGIGEDLETGLIDLSLYQHMKLDGDLASAMNPTDRPMRFSLAGLDLAPFFISDPAPPDWEPSEPDPDSPFGGRDRRGPPTQPYHLYFRRLEPSIVFGSQDSGVSNLVGFDGRNFMDAVWAEAPFDGHPRFVSTVERIATEWEGDGTLSAHEVAAIGEAARRAEEEMAQ
jgi:hypothetical protein